MKTKSASVQNLENLVEQIIDGEPENNDQMIDFHRMIYKKWHRSKRSPVSNETEPDRKQDDETNCTNAQDISATVTHRRLRRLKYKRLPDISSENGNEARRSEVTNLQKLVSSSVTDEKDHQHHKEPTPVDDDSDSRNYNDPNTAGDGDTKVIEIWSNRTKPTDETRLTRDTKTHAANQPRGSDQNQPRRDTRPEKLSLSFEDWKKKKTEEYRRMLKKIETEQQQKLMENSAKAEWKRIIQQKQTQCKRQQAKRERIEKKLLSKKHFKVVIEQEEPTAAKSDSGTGKKTNKEEEGEEVKPNKQTKRIRRSTLKNRKNAQKNRAIALDHYMKNVTFCSVLNQLNEILYKKYSRERRHLVQSYYCQPFYYGGANFTTR